MLKAIETRYKGYRFRSRLEARWAVFFDAIGVAWEYEKQGYDLDGMAYLPDFWLPSQRHWIEVKGERPAWKSDEIEVCRRLAAATGSDVFMVFSDLCPLGFRREPGLDSGYDPGDIIGSCVGFYPDGNCDDGCCEWGECPLCGVLRMAGHGQHEACGCVCNGSFARRRDRHPNELYCIRCEAHAWGGKTSPHRPWIHSNTPRLLRAYDAARSARFEHGETPR